MNQDLWGKLDARRQAASDHEIGSPRPHGLAIKNMLRRSITRSHRQATPWPNEAAGMRAPFDSAARTRLITVVADSREFGEYPATQC